MKIRSLVEPRSFVNVAVLVIKPLIYIFCTALFILAISGIWSKFEEGYTTTNLRFRDNGEKQKKLPCISICAVPPFKKRGVQFDDKKYDMAVFSQESIISSSVYKGEQFFNVVSIDSLVNGRCYTLYTKKESRPFQRSYISLHKNISLQFAVHVPGDEYWLHFHHYPVEITKNLFELPKLDRGIKFLSIGLTEKNYIKYSTKTNPCSQENNEVLKDCIRNKIKDKMGENCTVPGMFTMYENSDVPHCKNVEDTNLTMIALLGVINEYRKDILECPVPCNQTLYYLEYTLFHQNSDLIILNDDLNLHPDDKDLPELIVSIFFRSMVVEEHVEAVVYDLVNFLAAAGGNLGLLLGFSCLSTLLYFHDLIFRKR